MSDVHCAVCREPWDAYGVNHGDMKPWEAKLFKWGAGCPCCEGQVPEDANADENAEAFVRDVVIGIPWEGRHEEEALTSLEKRPAWERPADEAVWSCAGCDATVYIDADEAPAKVIYPQRGEYFAPYVQALYWKGGKYKYGCGGDWGDLLRETIGDDGKLAAPASREIDGKHYCPDCADTCEDCGTLTLADADAYEGGTMTHQDSMHVHTWCVDCFEKIPSCSYCGELFVGQEASDVLCNHGYCEFCRDNGHCDECPDEDENEDDEDEDEDEDEDDEDSDADAWYHATHDHRNDMRYWSGRRFDEDES